MPRLRRLGSLPRSLTHRLRRWRPPENPAATSHSRRRFDRAGAGNSIRIETVHSGQKAGMSRRNPRNTMRGRPRCGSSDRSHDGKSRVSTAEQQQQG
jgi:hypothetical protein